MPKGINADDVINAALKLLNQGKSNATKVVDDGKGIVAAATKAVQGLKPKPAKPSKPKATAPKKPPKSKAAAKKEVPLNEDGTPMTPRQIEKKALTDKRKADHAKERDAYIAEKKIESEARKAKNKADWAAMLEEKYGGNITAAVKATSKGSHKGKKGAK